MLVKESCFDNERFKFALKHFLEFVARGEKNNSTLYKKRK